jgi:Heparinase II/III-like protein/Heparinase II/III N-terminus
MAGQLPAFSHHWVDVGFPPRWHRSVISQVDADPPGAHWTRLPDFGLRGGDVKGYWEASRFDGLLILALGWLSTRRGDIGVAVERWMASWCADNPPNAGLQWKCGQETGIRLMQGLLAAELLQRWGGVAPTTAFCTWVAQHCARIAPTMLYAVGQDNNHGSSEAAALFTAGAFLVHHAQPALARRGRRWCATGRHWLENRLAHRVLADGSFAQHSLNYHRVLLDTCAFAETFRRWHGEPPFSALLLERCRAATQWLAAFTDPASGDAPNLGANDGARLFVLHRQHYRDFRPSVQWAARLFLDRREYLVGAHDEPLAWLGLDSAAAASPEPAAAQLWPDGGYARLAALGAWVMLRLPRYRFRPSHADALHLDLWVGGRNLLRDGGSYAYNAEPQWLRYFSGTESHNTVQFDGRDQMPRVSRFLFGDWLECEELHFDAAASTVVAAYRDSFGARHKRSVTLAAGSLSVTDEVSGMRERAVLRWRIAPSESAWTCSDGVWTDGTLRIAVRSTAPMARFECVDGWESRHYADKTCLPVLEVEVRSDATLTTEITWTA